MTKVEHNAHCGSRFGVEVRLEVASVCVLPFFFFFRGHQLGFWQAYCSLLSGLSMPTSSFMSLDGLLAGPWLCILSARSIPPP